MRVITSTSVLAVHVVANVSPMYSVPANGVAALLHYSRQVFFFVSALVLVHTYYPRLRPDGSLPAAGTVRRRRVAVIGVPYLVWGTVYTLIGLATAYSADALSRLPRTLGVGLLTGTAGYHTYFLLVSLEFTVVLPLLLRLLRATEGRHGRVLLVSALIQIATLACYHYVYLPDHGWRAVAGESSLLAYQFWLVAGGVLALHLEEFHAWARRWRGWVLATGAATAIAVEVVYAVGLAAGRDAQDAASSLQPVVVPWALAALVLVYLFGARLAASRRRLTVRLVRRGAELSFGIYLVHPAVLTCLLLLAGAPLHGVGAVLVTAVAIPVTLVLSWLVAAGLQRTRFSRALTGRPTRRRLPVARAAVVAPATATTPTGSPRGGG